AVIVASNGAMARMNTLHPIVFARFKHWMAHLADRDPRKRKRDELQATAVETVVSKYLPHLEADLASAGGPAVLEEDESTK
ncbi:MAG: GSU2403 family nucleotidyltransferase fold protein, partial [Caldimonas sp.]